MKNVFNALRVIHALMAALFACGALILIAIAARLGWEAAAAGLTGASAQGIIEALGLLAAAVVAIQICETILEEEVIRGADISAPTRVRRFLSRFFVVVIVALAVEALVATFKAVHEDLRLLGSAAVLIASLGILLAAWGVFIRLNCFAEELEPEAMADAKQEDKEVTEPSSGAA